MRFVPGSLALAAGFVLFAQCSSAPTTCANDCNAGATSCAGGILSTCQSVNGCLEYVKTSTCPSNACQDGTTCAMAPDCGSYTACDTCTAPSVVHCFWCPSTSSCVLTPDTSCPGPIGGDNNASAMCAESAACAPCTLVPITVCPDVTFECACASGKTPTDKACALQQGQEYCCSS